MRDDEVGVGWNLSKYTTERGRMECLIERISKNDVISHVAFATCSSTRNARNESHQCTHQILSGSWVEMETVATESLSVL